MNHERPADNNGDTGSKLDQTVEHQNTKQNVKVQRREIERGKETQQHVNRAYFYTIDYGSLIPFNIVLFTLGEQHFPTS